MRLLTHSWNNVSRAQLSTFENSKRFHQGEIMKSVYLSAVLTLMCVVGIGKKANAQETETVTVTVPFEFVAGGATLAAGEYRVSRVSPGVSRELVIHGYGKGGAFLLPVAFNEATSDQRMLSFEHVGDKYFLSGIKTEEGVYTLAPPRKQIALAQTNTQSSVQVSATGTK
jgi:hypothetical protein